MDHPTTSPSAPAPRDIIMSKKEGIAARLEHEVGHWETLLAKRDLKQRSKRYYELQLQMAKDQLHTHNPDPQTLKNFEITRQYQQARAQEREDYEWRLKRISRLARYADYAMVNCSRLMDIDENFAFRKLKWHEIVEKLNAEDAEHSHWESTREQGCSAPPPQRPYRSQLMRAMDMVGEQDFDQMFFEIRLYADRNLEFHNGVLELRERAEYDKLLEVLEEDEKSIDSVLSKNEVKDADKYRKAVERYRLKWWKEPDANGLYEKLPTTLKHEEIVRNCIETGTHRKLPDTPMEKIRKAVNKIKKSVGHDMEQRLNKQDEEIAELKSMIRTIGTAAASSDLNNEKQKRLYSASSFDDQSSPKRQKCWTEEDAADAAEALQMFGPFEDEMDMDEDEGTDENVTQEGINIEEGVLEGEKKDKEDEDD